MARQFINAGFVFLLLSLAALPFAARAFGDEALLDRQSEELFDSVMSPYCPGRTLSACPSDQARELRDQLRSQLAAGKSADELRGQLFKEFGDMAGKPRGEFLAPLAYLGVAAFFILGGVVMMRNIRSGGTEDVEEES